MAVPSACLQLSQQRVPRPRRQIQIFSRGRLQTPPPPPTARDKIKDKTRPIGIIYNAYVAPSSVNVQQSRTEGLRTQERMLNVMPFFIHQRIAHVRDKLAYLHEYRPESRVPCGLVLQRSNSTAILFTHRLLLLLL